MKALVALLMLGVAVPASATPFLFDADTIDNGHFSFTVDSSPAPFSFIPDEYFAVTTNPGNHWFYSGSAGGGFDLYYGDQLYTGTEAAPTFKLGTFGLFDSGGFQQLGTLTISVDGAVPEPASWAMMLGGFGAIGGALRARRKTSISFA